MTHAHNPAAAPYAPRSKMYKGRFGRICSDLPPWRPLGVPDDEIEAHFAKFATEHMTERPGLKPDELIADAEALDTEFGSNIPAGYTYFGQFIDHDITFDPTPLAVQKRDPEGLDNFRTPRLDLDCVYGNGPHDQPYLYHGGRFIIGEVEGSTVRDLPRNEHGRAIIGDMRNDENAMVSQLQLAFLMAHNELFDRALAAGADDPFVEARRCLTWLYQWSVWNDFLRRVCIDAVVDTALKRDETGDGRVIWTPGLSDVYNWSYNPFMPVEFAGAAYRFGHSMVRNAYQTNFANNELNRVPIFNNVTTGAGETDLRGFGPMTAKKAIQWDWFLQMESSTGPFPQMARKIDTKLANALLFLGERDAEPEHVENKLAARNLIRGVSLELPSGPDVAAHLGLTSGVNLKEHEPAALWYYILREAEGQGGARLGRLGSTIVCAVFAGLIKGDPMSWVNMQPGWTPADEPLLKEEDNRDGQNWGLPTVIRLSGLPVAAGDF